MTTLPVGEKGRAFTYADLESLPDDGRRYELSHGALVVTPAPNTRHQMIMAALAAFLHTRKMPSQRVLTEAELLLAPETVKRPDVQVVDENLVGGQHVVGVPDLVAEIHSPATKSLDVTEKRLAYAEHGIASYWLIDPDQRSLTVLHLEGGVYRPVATLGPDDSAEESQPFTMVITGRDILL
jgi:Uma2 family endonuclease